MESDIVADNPTTAGEQEWTLRKGYLQAPDGTQYPSLSQELADAINADLAAEREKVKQHDTDRAYAEKAASEFANLVQQLREQLRAAVEALKHVAQLADDQIAGIANDALAKIEGKWNLNLLNQVDIEEYLGIPWQWIDEINKACDAFFRKRGMPVWSIRESIHADTIRRVKQSQNRIA